MASIGDLWVRVLADLKKFTADLQTQTAKSGDKAATTFGQRMSAGLKKFGSSIGAGFGLGAGVAGFQLLDRAIQGVISGLGDAVQAAREEERSVAGLDAALKANVRGWDGNREAIEKVLASRMKLGFADDEQRTSLARLIAITKDANEALRLQGVAMDLARLRGIDLAAASDIVGKVFGGNIGILSRYGIQIKRGATATEALAKVQEMAAGQAEAWAETNDGKLIASQIRVGELMEKFGGFVLPLVADSMGAVADGADTISAALDLLNGKLPETEQETQDLALQFANAAAQVPFFGQAIKPLAGELNNLGGQLDAARNKAGTFADGSIDAVERARLGIGPDGHAIGEAIGGIGDKAKSAATVVKRSAQDIIDAVLRIRTALVEGATEAAEAIYNPIIAQAEVAAAEVELSEARQVAAKTEAGSKEREIAEGRVAEAEVALIRAQANAASYGEDTAQISFLKAEKARILSSDEWRKGTDEQRTILQRRMRQIDGELDRLTGIADKGGKNAGRAMRDGFVTPISTLPEKAYAWGRRAALRYAAGLESQQHAVETAASRLAGAVGSYLKVSSPAEKGPLSEGGGPEGWGERGAALYVEGWEARLARLGSVLGNALAAPTLTPQMAFASPSPMSQLSAPAVSSVGSRVGSPESVMVAQTTNGDTYHIHMEDRMKPTSVREIASNLRMLEDQGYIGSKRRRK